MKGRSVVLSGSLLALAVLVMTGCETGRTIKLHSPHLLISDVTTVPAPRQPNAQDSVRIPLVPGSPTASLESGIQPIQDRNARHSLGTEGGKSAVPHTNWSNGFIRQ
ncbi:hypothetical protein [Paracidobacterium acidisoli]|uniref:Lipoprotein n=1 Tax=Paracidobacterium acidisoli TaxID=2303751 RepID=A0A372ISY6_9BACT|nr:hypothetical protein [Paracidobacterium acidisoli]MBT9329450.1 hypothetical protein [Paracidobacterium acidisoli]